MLNLLRLHAIARPGDGLDPAICRLLARRQAIETDPKIAVLHPGLSMSPSPRLAAAAPGNRRLER